MDIIPIPFGNGGDNPTENKVELDLRHLLVFDTIMLERSLTRAAEVLGVTQPALSKTLARLRIHFSDPLFVRVSMSMEPTTKALELEGPIRELLDQMRALQIKHVPFDPATSSRMFNFSVVDAGVIRLLPPLVDCLLEKAPKIQLSIKQVEVEHLGSWLESGKIDFAVGSFPTLAKSIRSQKLWTESYVCVVRKDHPRLDHDPTLEEYAREKHVLVSTSGTGHAHVLAERAIKRVVPASNITCSVPMFAAAASVAKHSDALATLPLSLSTVLAEDMGLEILQAPIDLPQIDISQYWHQRFHNEPGTQWIRAIFRDLFRSTTKPHLPANLPSA